MGEIDWTKRICKEMVQAGAMIFPIVASKMQPPGWPDRIVVHKLGMWLVEFKGERTALRPVQRVIINDLWKRGPYVWIVRYPNFVGDSTFDGTGRGLLQEMFRLTVHRTSQDQIGDTQKQV